MKTNDEIGASMEPLRKPAAAPQAVPDERAAFEAWLMKYLEALTWTQDFKDWYFMRNADGNYVQQAARERWDCWQARAALAATQPAAQGMDAQLVAFIEKVRDFKAQAVRVGSSQGQIRWDIEYGHYGDEVSAKTLSAAITKAIAAQAKQGGA